MKPTFRPLRAGILGIGLCIGALVQAQAAQVGFVRTDRILKEATIAKEAQARIEREFSARDRELTDQAVDLKTMMDKLQVEAPTLSEAQRASRQKSLAEQDRELQRKRRAFQEDLNARKNEEWQQLLAQANRVVKQVAETEKYDFVVQDAVYINPKYDITDKILAALNAQKTSAQ
jgi:outer membrane protein